MKRIDGLDIIKAVGIMMVLSLHVPLWNPYFMENYSIGTLAQYAGRIISPGVPLFMAVNGFLLLKREKMDLKKHFSKVIKCIGLLVLWGFLLAFWGLCLLPGERELSVYNLIIVVLKTQVGSDYTGVLWFLQYLIAVYLIYPVIWYMFQNNYHLFQYLFMVTFVFSVGKASICQFEHLLATRINTECLYLFNEFIDKLNPVGNVWYTFYFMLGGVIWKKIDTLQKKRWRYVIVGLAAWGIAVGYGMVISFLSGSTYDPAYGFGCISMVLFIIGFFALVIPYQSKNRSFERLVLSIGQNTFGIYFLHYIFIFLILHFWNYNTLNRFEYRLIAYTIVFVCSYVSSYVIKKIPYLRCIIEL